ncbi:ABC transporter substrate-binding protein [Curtanaerobium respiraculi]|uniref:ABC transporter substrate-binding protein n=1 Tax=Curtanaerobium respiraculi TaxID=2949669 RepID=UPI0024B329FD|nr:ABC transporter substrate-binding protein [Curtanaerobium respiraculi]
MNKKSKILLVAALGALVAALALAGCSSGGTSSSSSSSAGKSDAGSYSLVKEGTLTVGTSPDFPPFENLEGDEYVGFDMDLGKAVAEKMGLAFAPTTIQFDGIIPAVIAGGQCDIGLSGFSIDPERAQQIDFSDAYYVDDQAVVAMKSSQFTAENVDTAVNSADVVIAVQSGTTGEDYAKENFPNATVKPYGNATDCFAALQAGEANIVCTNNAVAKNTIANSYQDAQVIKADATGEEYAIVVSKDNPELTKAVNAALAELQKDGTIDKLTQKYFG